MGGLLGGLYDHPMKRPAPKSKQPTKPTLPIQSLDTRNLRDVRGGDGGITAGDDWEARI
jgi:hypothetical protein